MTHVLLKRALVAAALLGASLGFVAPVAHAGGPVERLILPSFIEAGAVGSLSVTDFNSSNGCPEGDVVLTIQPQGGSVTPWLTIPAASIVNGGATVPFTAPGSPGDYNVVATRGPCTALAILEVTPSTTAPPTTAPPTTAPPTTAAPTTAAPTTARPTTAPPTTAAPTTAAPAAAPVLPATGPGSDGLVWLAILTLLLGGGMVSLAARRR